MTNHYNHISNKVFSHDSAVNQVQSWQTKGEKIVFTNGCFDLVHRGHVEYLAKAADLGTKMIVGLNTDASVSRIKGPSRPLVDEQSRAILMAAFEFVDMIVFFDEETPYELIKALQPDVLVKGSDYKAENIVGYDIVTGKGGTVETIDFVPGFSTTSLIKKIMDTH
jgi:D-glycero-beta-D-manno-heptose 1-phosphate adenylyltransferase